MAEQEAVDGFYWHNGGPCCAGCDWWRHLNSVVGECIRSAPVSSQERLRMVGIDAPSMEPGAGHVLTPREHYCGEFRDGFDWGSLPPAYLRRVGYRKPC